MREKFLCVVAQFDIETSSEFKGIGKILKEAGFVGEQTPDIPYHIMKYMKNKK